MIGIIRVLVKKCVSLFRQSDVSKRSLIFWYNGIYIDIVRTPINGTIDLNVYRCFVRMTYLKKLFILEYSVMYIIKTTINETIDYRNTLMHEYMKTVYSKIVLWAQWLMKLFGYIL